MDKKSVKKLLVEARDAIKSKDYSFVIRNCQEILKYDKNNYNALVFSGIALQEMQESEQAEKAFQKAIDVSPDQILAWQGLRSFYEKEPSKYLPQLISVYLKFVDFYQDDKEKLLDTCYRLAVTYYNNENFTKAIEHLKQALLLSGTEVLSANAQIWTTLALWLSNQLHLSAENFELLTNAVNNIIEGKKCEVAGLDSWNFASFEKYFECLIKEQCYYQLLDALEKLASIFKEHSVMTKWKLKAYISSCAVGTPIILKNFEELCCAIPEGKTEEFAYALMSKGSHMFLSEKWVEAKDFLLKGLKIYNLCWEGWLLLCWALDKMHDGPNLEHCTKEGLKIMQNQLQEPKQSNINCHFQLCLGKGILYQESSVDLTKCTAALEIAASNPHLKVESLYLQGTVHVKLKKWEQVEKILEKLQKCQAENVNNYMLALEGFVHCEQGDLQVAKQKLIGATDISPKNADWLLQLGIVYWKSQEHLLAHDCFWKSATLDSYNPLTFLMLGLHYEQIAKELRKARRCYQVAHDLDPHNDEIGIQLSTIYQNLNDEEANLVLLRSVTSNAPSGRSKWAWLRLGLLHLRQENPDLAIKAFQAALRADPLDRECWQCLAEAYLLRGSHTAALKAFNRVLELEPQALYCTYQVANIKLTLGLYKEAAEVFEKIVKKVPMYVPALKGLGESYIFQARSYLQSCLSSKALSLLELALDPLARAVTQEMEFACLWKLLGDTLTIPGRINVDIIHMKVPNSLLKGNSSSLTSATVLDKKGVLEVGMRCYLVALRCAPSNANLWHDLGVNCYYQGLVQPAEEKIKYLNKSMTALKKAVSLKTTSPCHWNALGIVSASSELKNYRLAQHAFIKAVKAEPNFAAAWANLGTLYLVNNSMQLANQAYRMAQSVDPSFVNSWIGQATIAEKMGHEDAMDLFRHCTSLGNHEEGLIGYASWVCSTLLNLSLHNTEAFRYSINQMAAVPAAIDCLFHYTDVVHNDHCVYNMLGLLLERQGLLRDARKHLEKALHLLKTDSSVKISDMVRCNFARVLRKQGLIDLAIEEASVVKESEFYNHCGLAACYYQLGLLDESGSAYESALQWLANTNEEKSHLMVTMSSMAYQLRGPEEAKTILFESFQLKPVCVQGLLALCALGILQSDAMLISATIKELQEWSGDERFQKDVVYLEACCALLQNDLFTARNLYCKAIHKWPTEWCFWKLLATYLMKHSHVLPLATYCISAAAKIHRSSTLEILQLLALCKTFSGSEVEGSVASKALIHCYPGEIKNWYFLANSFKHLMPAKEFLTVLQKGLKC